MKRLTKKKAIELSIELWTWLAETGKEKRDWPEWKKYPDIAGGCFLCEYDGESNCDRCPYYQKFVHCCDGPYDDWCEATTEKERKKYAGLFLGQLNQLLEEKMTAPRIALRKPTSHRTAIK